MSDLPKTLEVGALYSNEEVYRSLELGNAGGVRIKIDSSGHVRRAALFTSIPTARQLIENPYQDRLEGDVLVYTGTGLAGDQGLSGANARIQQQSEQHYPIYGFAQVASRRATTRDNKRWMFLGLLDFLRCYSERQLDATGAWRSVRIFELLVHGDTKHVSIDHDREAATLAHANAASQQRLLDKELSLSVGDPQATGSPLDTEQLEPIRRTLLALDPRKFEFFVRDLLVQSGFEKVEVTRFSQDGGIDVNARPGRNSMPIRELLVQIQAKRWLHTVGRKEVAELRGSLQPHAAGCIITTSHFSRAALVESREPGKVPITVIDGYELASWTKAARLELA